jgi:hypothetical protein
MWTRASVRRKRRGGVEDVVGKLPSRPEAAHRRSSAKLYAHAARRPMSLGQRSFGAIAAAPDLADDAAP